MNQFEAMHRKGMGLPYDQRAYEHARDNGLLGSKPDPEYEEASRMDDFDSLSFTVRSFESIISPEGVDATQDRLLQLLAELQKKEVEHLPITTQDIARNDIQIAEFVVGAREEYIEHLRAHDPLFVQNTWEWIDSEANHTLEANDGVVSETDALIAKIDAAEKMVAQLHAEVTEGDVASREDPKLLEITMSIRDELVAELTAEELSRYYALAA